MCALMNFCEFFVCFVYPIFNIYISSQLILNDSGNTIKFSFFSLFALPKK